MKIERRGTVDWITLTWPEWCKERDRLLSELGMTLSEFKAHSELDTEAANFLRIWIFSASKVQFARGEL